MPRSQRSTAAAGDGEAAGSSAVPRVPPYPPDTHIAGEMFVAAELAKRGYLVSLTMGNAKAVDLFVERDGRALCVQVKAIARRRYSGWPLPTDKNKIQPKNSLLRSDVIWVCVILNDIGQPPTYFILRPKDVLRLGTWHRTRAILNVGKLLQDKHRFEDAWHRIEDALVQAAPAG